MYSEQEIDNIVMALLFASDEPLSVRKIAAVLGDESAAPVNASLERLKTRLESEHWSITLESIAGGYQLATRKQYASYVAKLYVGKRKQRLSRAGLETLAIIAYKQPVTRADIEQIRGVSCGGVISTLMERSLIKITGKARVLGAPFLYGTGGEFLEYLGLNSIRDLPSMEELEQILAEKEQTEEASGDLSLTAAAEPERAPADPIQPIQSPHNETRDEDLTIDEDERHT